MSHGAYAARATPRWSVTGQPALSPAFTAGLLTGSACVSVGPPLAASGPRRGSVSERSPAPAKAQVRPLSKLWPLEVNAGPLQLGPLFTKMLFKTATVSPVPLFTPAPTLALFRASVTFVRASAEAPVPEL